VGNLGKKYSSLKREDEFILADAMRSLDGRTFTSWKGAISYFSIIVKRPLTRRNLEGIAKDLKLNISNVVIEKPPKRKPTGFILKMKRLEARLDDHERQISRLIEQAGLAGLTNRSAGTNNESNRSS